jgi:GNAT superfamily N-acetyltransferase
MFRVKTLSRDDFAFAVHLTDTMDWNLTKEDFMFMQQLEPKGCFILLDNAERVGVATSIGFDTMGWIGNVIIREDYRGKGAGSLLVKHALKYLKRQVETIGVYAYLDTIPFYQRLGFEYDSTFRVLKGKRVPSLGPSHGREATQADISEIIALDERCVGASRSKLLKSLLLDSRNLCYVAEEQRSLRGFVVAKVYHEGAEVGPLVCQEGCVDIALDLLKAALHRLKGVEAVMCIPAKASRIRNTVMLWGFREDFRVARMFYGTPVVGDSVFLAESLERG